MDLYFNEIDVIYELFYSIESLKLLNCIEAKQMIIYLAKYLFPDGIVEKIANVEDNIKDQTTARFRHLRIN